MRYLLVMILSILFATQTCLAGKIATDPYPEDDFFGVSVGDIFLSWTNMPQAEFVNVYIDDELEVEHEGISSYCLFVNYDRTYKWRVDSIKQNKVWLGDDWSFTTVPEPSTLFLLGIGSLVLVKRKKKCTLHS